MLRPLATAAILGLALAACAQQGAGSAAGASPPPAPAYTALTYDQAIAQGGRRLMAAEVRERAVGKTCQGSNRGGPLTVTWRPDGTATATGPQQTLAMTWAIQEDGALCRTVTRDNDRSCQPWVLVGTVVATFDEQGRHRSTLTGCT
jgi:hypothetical protein